MSTSKLILIILALYFFNLKTYAQTQKGIDIDGEAAGDFSGQSVSMPDANTIAIGAPYNNGGGSNGGHARIYSWNGNAWIQKGLDIDGESNDDRFGESVCMPDANTIAIGAPRNSGGGALAGHVRIFTWNGNAWIQKGLDIEGEFNADFSGSSVSMPDINTVAIGAPNNSGNGTYSGHVRVYNWNGNVWIQKGTDINGEAAFNHSGCSVSMPDDNTIAIGALNNSGNGSNAGHARIYTWDGNSWIQKGSDIDGDVSDNFAGTSVSMPDANTIAIGAPGAWGSFGPASGQVRIFTWNGTWTQKGNDILGEDFADNSGHSVSMPDANTVAIGAPGNWGGSGLSTGHVRVYSWNGNTWIQNGIDIDGENPIDESGRSVSMPDDNTVAIGAPGNGNYSGHVRIYSVLTVGVQETNFENNFTFYPNPTNEVVNIKLNSTYHKINIVIRDIMNKEVKRVSFTNTDELNIKLPEENGVYFFEIFMDNKSQIFKIIKK